MQIVPMILHQLGVFGEYTKALMNIIQENILKSQEIYDEMFKDSIWQMQIEGKVLEEKFSKEVKQIIENKCYVEFYRIKYL